MQAERGCDFEKVKLWSHNLLALAVRSSKIDETEREEEKDKKVNKKKDRGKQRETKTETSLGQE